MNSKSSSSVLRGELVSEHCKEEPCQFAGLIFVNSKSSSDCVEGRARQ